MVPLTEPDPVYFIRGADLHPNGRWLVYGANFDVATGHEIGPTWIYRHDLKTGERCPLARLKRPGFIWPELSPSGTHVLYTRMDLHPAGRQVWLVDVEGGEDREILNFGPEVKTFASWFPDGKHILVLDNARTHRRLGVWEMAGDVLHWLLDNPGSNIEVAFVPYGGQQIVVVEVQQARACSYLLDPQTGEVTYMPEVPGTLIPLAPVGDGQWVGQYYSSRQPADLVRFSLDRSCPEDFVSLTQVWQRTHLTAEDLTAAESFHWKSVDGLEIQGWLYRTKGKAKGTVVYVHGGPTYHTEDQINPQVQFLVRCGFNVLDPNYRGSTGFSLGFREAIKVHGWGGLEQEDIRTGIKALIAAGIAEPGKVGITGTSYGGYTAWCAITRFPREIVAAAAPICGMTDLVVDYYSTQRFDLRTYTEEMMGGSPEQVPERYHERSPIHFVHNIKGRLLIVHGLRDPNVSPENFHVVISALQQAGIPYQLLTFDDEGHGISKPKNQRVLYLRLAEFFESAFSV
jgi:dipeptidyl aminopeptidase/acylaminoacyl peptidase